jgi:hypothetical protein
VGLDHIALVTPRDLVELLARFSRFLDVPTGERNLDPRREQLGASQWLADFAEDATHRCRRRGDLPLREAQEREARLRFVPTAARGPVCLLCGAESPPQPVHLTLTVVRTSTRELVQDAACEPLGRLPCLRESVFPLAAQLRDLRTVDETEAIVRDHPALAIAPAAQRIRPFACMAQRVRVPAERDGVAVDDAGHPR